MMMMRRHRHGSETLDMPAVKVKKTNKKMRKKT